MRKGLFATAFGPSFYRGYVGRQEELVAVGLPTDGAGGDLDDGQPRWDARRRAATVFLIGGAAAAVGGSVLGVLTWNAKSRYDDTTLERPSSAAKADYDHYRLLTITTGVAAVVLVAAGATVFYWPHRRGAAGPAVDRLVLTGGGLATAGHF
jgi:hypothetical protein